MNKPDSEFIFIPLGGSNEIGMNLNLYGYNGKWMIADIGVMFGDDSTPGIDVMMPDTSFIEKNRKDLVGIVLTHAHEDHMGAIPYLWTRLKCPVYCTPFTYSIVKRKLVDVGLAGKVPLKKIPLASSLELGPFSVSLLGLTHSIPEQNALIIETPAGRVLHTGDWKFDPDPLVGKTSDEAALKKIGKKGIDVLVCDSTNVMVSGSSGSEADVRTALIERVADYKGRVAIAGFASNIARLETIALAAQKNGRVAVLAGRSFHNMYAAAIENGYLKGIPPFIPAEEAMHLPPHKVLYACTGSQGEPRAALSRIASRTHPTIALGDGDVVIFSSRKIPGNEKGIIRLQNRLVKLGVDIVTAGNDLHVSGHPAKDELRHMYNLVKPKCVIPVHGEALHLHVHANFARSCGVPKAIVVENGSVVNIGPGEPSIIDQIETGRYALEGERVIKLNRSILNRRTKVLEEGLLVATVHLDSKGILRSQPQLTTYAIFDGEDQEAVHEDIAEAISDEINSLSNTVRAKDGIIEEAVRYGISSACKRICGKKPLIRIHLVRG